MKSILHIASDEKFINAAYWQFEKAFPNENFFYILVEDVNKPLLHITLDSNFLVIPNSMEVLKNLHNEFGNAKIVCFHGLDYHRSIILNNTPKNYKTVWFLFGFEFYNNPLLMKQETLLFVKKRRSDVFKVLDILKEYILRRIYYKIKYGTKTPYGEAVCAMKSAQILGVLYKEEFNLITETLKSDSQFLKFTYYPIELMIMNSQTEINGEDILVGNSASETNNHSEVFGILKKRSLEEKRIITPLSYGNTKYQQKILKMGYEMFSNNFEPLTKFVKLHDYNEYIRKCGIVIMNHYRQQAVGNVLTTLWMGARVFLSRKNTLYHYLKRLGVHVFLIEDISCKSQDFLNILSEQEQIQNRKILNLEIGKETLIKSLKNDINRILNER